MTLSDFKALYLEHNPEGHFFNPDTIQFFGSTERKVAPWGPGQHMYSEYSANAGHWGAYLFDSQMQIIATGRGDTRLAAMEEAHLAVKGRSNA